MPKSSPAKESAAAVSVDESMYIADHSVLAPSAIKRSQDVMAGYGRYQNQSHAGTAKANSAATALHQGFPTSNAWVGRAPRMRTSTCTGPPFIM